MPHHDVGAPRHVPSLHPPQNFQNEKIWHRRQIWLDYEQQSENSILVLTCLESDWEPNTIVIDHSLLFPMIIYTNLYDQRSKRYEFLNIRWAAASLCWQTRAIWKTACLTTEALSSQKTCNTKLVVNFPHFSVITRALKSDRQRRSYAHRNTVDKWKNLEYRFWFRLTMIPQNLADWIWCRIRRNE
jgi:hypothetical protein